MTTNLKTDNNEIFVKKDGVLKKIDNIEMCSNCKECFKKKELLTVEDIVLCSDCFIGAINIIISKGKL